MKQICLCFPKRQTGKVYSVKSYKILLKKNMSIYLNCLQVGHSFHEILQDCFTFPVLALVLQFIQLASWYNLYVIVFEFVQAQWSGVPST